MYSVAKHGDTFMITPEFGVAIVLGPASGVAYQLFLHKYNTGFVPCDAAFDRWVSEEPCSVVDLLNMCSMRSLRPDELSVDSTTNQSATNKPPTGLTPRSIWLTSCAEARVTDITQAMQRCTAARLPIPQDWLAEYNELCTQLKGS